MLHKNGIAARQVQERRNLSVIEAEAIVGKDA